MLLLFFITSIKHSSLIIFYLINDKERIVYLRKMNKNSTKLIRINKEFNSKICQTLVEFVLDHNLSEITKQKSQMAYNIKI